MSANRKPIIGLAGGVGAGKSTVAKMLAELGCVVADSDALARAALGDPRIKRSIVQRWGDQVLDKHREASRSALAKIVFSDPLERRWLEDLTHPWIEARRREIFANAPAEAPALVIDAPLLFEAGLDRACDAVIFVESERPTRLSRVTANRGWTTQDLARRESSQMPLDQKRSRAHHVVQNNGDLGELKAQVRQILRTIVESRRTGHA